MLLLIFCRRDHLWITSRTHHLFPREMTTKPVVHGGVGKCGLFSQAIISERLEQARQPKLACVPSLLLVNFSYKADRLAKKINFCYLKQKQCLLQTHKKSFYKLVTEYTRPKPAVYCTGDKGPGSQRTLSYHILKLIRSLY